MYYKEWLKEWLENYVEPMSKSKTFSRYSEIVEQHIIPRLGELTLEELTPNVLQRYVTSLLKAGNLKTGKGLAPNSVKYDYNGDSWLVKTCMFAGIHR